MSNECDFYSLALHLTCIVTHGFYPLVFGTMLSSCVDLTYPDGSNQAETGSLWPGTWHAALTSPHQTQVPPSDSLKTDLTSDMTSADIIFMCYFILPTAPSSCVVTEWGEWDPCSVTCGLGMRRRERMVKMPPIDGSMCKAEVAEVDKCMMPDCRE